MNAEDIKRFVVSQLADPILAKTLIPEHLPDDFDLLSQGILDSLGFVDLIVALEHHFEIKVDFSDLDPEDLTVLGPFSRYIEEKNEIASTQRVETSDITTGTLG